MSSYLRIIFCITFSQRTNLLIVTIHRHLHYDITFACFFHKFLHSLIIFPYNLDFSVVKI